MAVMIASWMGWLTSQVMNISKEKVVHDMFMIGFCCIVVAHKNSWETRTLKSLGFKMLSVNPSKGTLPDSEFTPENRPQKPKK